MKADHPASLRGDSRAVQWVNAAPIVAAAGVVALVLSLVVISASMAARLASTLNARLAGQVTVVVWGRGLESTDAAAARAAELLAGQPGIRRVTIMDADERDATIGQLVAGHTMGVEPPRLLSLSGAPSTSHLRSLLTANGLTTAFDDHHGAGGPLERRVLSVATLGIGLGLVLCGVLFSVGFMSGSRAPSRPNPHYDLMRRLGADPAWIAEIIARRSAACALVGGLAGTLCADLMVSVLPLNHGVWLSLGIPNRIWRDWIWTAACPLMVATVVGAAGGLGAWRRIIRQERNP